MTDSVNQAPSRVVWLELNNYVCANLSASDAHPMWRPVAMGVTREEFEAVTSSPNWNHLYFTFGIACTWGTMVARERAAKAIGRLFSQPYSKPKGQRVPDVALPDKSVA